MIQELSMELKLQILFHIKLRSEFRLEINRDSAEVKEVYDDLYCSYFKSLLLLGHTCGGVLISRKTVTTAAHCLFDGLRQRNAFDVRVVFGSLNRYIYTDETVIRTAEKIIVHPEYRRRESFAHDIGLIIVSFENNLKDEFIEIL